MNKQTIINTSDLIKDSYYSLDARISFDLQVDLGESEEEIFMVDVVRVLSKAPNEYLTLDDVHCHLYTNDMFMLYSTFIKRYTQSKGIPYAGTFQKLFDENGCLVAFSIETIF